MSTEKDPNAKPDLQRRFLIGSSLAFAGTAASGVLTGCGGNVGTGGTGSAAGASTPTGATPPTGTSAPPAATPAFTPTAGTYSGAQNVTLSSATSGAQIHYTLDGSTPTMSSAVYSAAIQVNATKTVQAIATASGYQPSSVASAAYTISGGTVTSLAITMTSPLPNAVEGNLYTATMTASGGVPPYTWALVSDIQSTNAWTVSSSGAVSGTPANFETDTLSIKVTDSKGNVAGPQSFSIAVQSASGLPSAPVNLQLINQGGPNNADAQGHYVWQNFTFYYSALATGYQGFSWLPATPGTNPVAHYKIYRNGAAYDTVATPITITGYIVPSEDPVTALNIPNGLLHVTAVSGGTTSISDGKILCGLLLTSSAPGFVAGTRLNLATVYTGSGGTGTYYVTNSQTCGSAASPVTFQGWSYNDTQSTNCTYPGFNAPGVVYAYAVSAVDAQGNEGPKAYPSVYQFYGYSNTIFGNFDYDGTQTWNDTSGAPLNGPYDTYAEFSTNGGGLLMTFGGFAPYPPYGTGTVPGCLCCSSRLEVGAFNYLVCDIKPTDNTFETSELQYYGVTRAYGNSGGGDNGHWNLVDIRPYCTPPLAVGQWSHCKVPFSAMTYGFSYGNGSFAATSQYNGTLTITDFTSLPVKGPDGSAYVSGPGIPPNTYINMANYNSNESPPSGAGPWVYQVMSPNIVGTETGSGAYTFQNTSIYKHGFQWSPAGSGSANLGNWYMNNIGFSTV
jgi:Chitobiase/beta-hexosaminidase C-terminal domain